MHTEDAAQSRSLLLHGRPEPPVTPVPLRAGDLDLLYEDGALRLIRRGTHEVVRSIYAAVRNQHWETVPGTIHDEKIDRREDAFDITYRREYDWHGVRYTAHCRISGDSDGIAFSFQGTAQSEFQRNRIGICVLHPVRECAGVECTITTPDGTSYEAPFPVRIKHDQPFLNVQAMRWPCGQDGTATLEFAGDVFETEDQRNFADASYKTYSTPQERPKPVAVHPGDQVTQSVTLRVTSARAVAPRRLDAVTLTAVVGDPRSLPELGLGVSTTDAPLSEADVQALRALRLSHLRVALDMVGPDWRDALQSAREESAALGGVPLDLALTLGKDPKSAWDALDGALRQSPVPVRSVLLLRVPSADRDAIVSLVRAALPDATVGSGTSGPFIEFNSNPHALPESGILSISAHPQIHLEDNRTVTENAAALGDIVQSARALTDDRAIHIAPLVLKPGADPRQKSLLGAVWALSSAKHLAEAGADSVTFGPTAGHDGIVREGAAFPIYFVLREIWGDGPAEVLPLASDDPSRAEGLLLRRGEALRLILANTTALTETVRVAWDEPQARLRVLDDAEAHRVLSDPAQFQGGEQIARGPDGFVSLTLPPFAIAVLETVTGA